MKRAIVVPVGQEPCIAQFVIDASLTFPSASFFFVVDSFTDRDTLDALNKTISRFMESWGHVVRAPGGIARAYHAGYQAAFRAGCETLLEMDVGHDCSSAASALRSVVDGDADFAAGVRWGVPGAMYDSRDEPWRWLLSRGGSALVGTAVGDDRLVDWTSGMHAMNRRVLEAVLAAVRDDFPPGRWWQTAVRVAAMRAANKVGMVPISYKPTGKVPPSDVVASLGRVARLWWSRA